MRDGLKKLLVENPFGCVMPKNFELAQSYVEFLKYIKKQRIVRRKISGMVFPGYADEPVVLSFSPLDLRKKLDGAEICWKRYPGLFPLADLPEHSEFLALDLSDARLSVYIWEHEDGKFYPVFDWLEELKKLLEDSMKKSSKSTTKKAVASKEKASPKKKKSAILKGKKSQIKANSGSEFGEIIYSAPESVSPSVKANHYIWRAHNQASVFRVGALKNVKNCEALDYAERASLSWPKNAKAQVEMTCGKEQHTADSMRGYYAFISEPLKRFLESQKLQNVEFLPFELFDEEGEAVLGKYWVMHPLTVVDAIDIDASGVEWNDIDPDMASSFKPHLVLKESKIPKSASLFRLKHHLHEIIIRADLCDKLLKAGFTGLSFESPTEHHF